MSSPRPSEEKNERNGPKLLINTPEEALAFFKEHVDCFSEPILKKDEFAEKLANNTNLKKAVEDLSNILIKALHTEEKIAKFRQQYDHAISELVTGNEVPFKELLDTSLLFPFFKFYQSDFYALVNFWQWKEKAGAMLGSAYGLLYEHYKDRESVTVICEKVVEEIQTGSFNATISTLLKLPPKYLLNGVSQKLKDLFEATEQKLAAQNAILLKSNAAEKTELVEQNPIKRAASEEIPKGSLQQMCVFNEETRYKKSNHSIRLQQKPFKPHEFTSYLNELNLLSQDMKSVMDNVRKNFMIQHLLNLANDFINSKAGNKYSNEGEKFIKNILLASLQPTNLVEKANKSIELFKESLSKNDLASNQLLISVISAMEAEITENNSTKTLTICQ